MKELELIAYADKARKHAYAPYSHFKVGAALETSDGEVYSGCNIENAAYTPTNCAERTAFFKAISEGHTQFSKIAIIGGYGDGPEGEEFCPPCGVCRQVMTEFCDPETFRILLAKSSGEYQDYLLKELLPNSFGPQNLMENKP